jgi:hypothetical protein
MMIGEHTEGRDPLIEALDAIDEIDEDYMETHPADEANDELDRRMKTLRCAATAISELQDRGEPTTSDAVREEMATLGEDFRFESSSLVEIGRGLLNDGEFVNADRCQRALQWMAIRYGQPPAV